MGTSAEAASNAETAVTQLVQLFTIRAQVLIQASGRHCYVSQGARWMPGARDVCTSQRSHQVDAGCRLLQART